MLCNCSVVFLLCLPLRGSDARSVSPGEELLDKCPYLSDVFYSPTCNQGQVHLAEAGDVEVLATLCTPTLVEVLFLPERFHEINDPLEIFKFSGSLRASWELPCNGYTRAVDDINFSAEGVGFWVPKMYHKNAVSNFAMNGDGYTTRFNVNYRLYNATAGKLKFLWQLFGVWSSTCGMDISLFPFDRQTCSVDIAMKGNAVAVQFGVTTQPRLQPDFMPPGVSWSFESIEAATKVVNIEGNRSVVSFVFHWKRRAEYYVYSLIGPCCLLSSLQICSFIMPPQCPDRPVFTITILLALTFLQGQIYSRIPPKPQRSYMTNYTDMYALFSWVCTVYTLISLAYVKIWKAWFQTCIKFRLLHLTITRARFIDVISFSVALALFLAINVYALGVATIAGYI